MPEKPLDLKEDKELLNKIIDVKESKRILEKYRGILGRVDPELVEDSNNVSLSYCSRVLLINLSTKTRSIKL
ncbi:MAG: antitoxin family protein [Desulfurococcales archaeon]|nr:antitoxin family protein [Desulfurococcales archaeon]